MFRCILLLLAMVLAGCVAPGQVASVPHTSGDLALPAEAFELPPQELHIEPLPEGTSLAFTSVMLRDLNETGWNRVQVTLTSAEWRKPLLLADKDMTVTIDGTSHVTSLDGGGHVAHATPEEWRLPDQPLYDEVTRILPAGAVVYITWNLPESVPPSASLEIDLWSAHYASHVPTETTVGETRRDPVIIGRHEHLERFTPFGTEFWDVQKVVAKRDDGPVHTLEVQFVATLEQDMEDAWVGIEFDGDGGFSLDDPSWFVLGEGSSSLWYARDLDRSTEKGWADVEDVVTLRIDLASADMEMDPGSTRFDIAVGPAGERPVAIFVPAEGEWDDPTRTVLFEQAPPPEDTGTCEEEGCGGGSG